MNMSKMDRGDKVRKIREDIDELGLRSAKSKDYWGTYRYNAREYVAGVFATFANEFPDAEKSLKALFAEKHAEGKLVFVADICGIADAKSLGADHTYCLTRRLKSALPLRTESRTIFERDIFRPTALKSMLAEFKEIGSGPSCIFFMPVGGLLGVPAETRRTAMSVLARHFDKLYEVLEPGGHMYMQRIPFFVHTWEQDEFIQHVLGKQNVRVDEGERGQSLRIIKEGPKRQEN